MRMWADPVRRGSRYGWRRWAGVHRRTALDRKLQFKGSLLMAQRKRESIGSFLTTLRKRLNRPIRRARWAE